MSGFRQADAAKVFNDRGLYSRARYVNKIVDKYVNI